MPKTDCQNSVRYRKLEVFLKKVRMEFRTSKGPERAVFELVAKALGSRSMRQYEYAIEAVEVWRKEHRILDPPVGKAEPRSRPSGSQINEYGPRGHSSRASRHRKAARISKDGIGLGSTK